jgi:hypothetical protein
MQSPAAAMPFMKPTGSRCRPSRVPTSPPSAALAGNKTEIMAYTEILVPDGCHEFPRRQEFPR